MAQTSLGRVPRGTPDQVVDAYCIAVLTDARIVHKIRSKLKGKRLACTCAGWRCHVDNLAEIANCNNKRLQEIVREANKKARYY